MVLSGEFLEVMRLADRLMEEFGLPDWGFRFNGRRRQLGRCVGPHQGKPGRIELSVHYVDLNDMAHIEDTIRHEIAHALAGPGAKHGPRWVAACQLTGANPEVQSDSAQVPMGRWRATCPSCGFVHSKVRKPKYLNIWCCTKCGPEKGGLRFEKLASSAGRPAP